MAEQTGSSSPDHREGRTRRLLALHEVLFSLSVAFAFCNTFYLYLTLTRELWPRSSYYLLRAAARVNGLLNLNSAAVMTDRVAREFPSRWGQLGQELTVLVSVLGAGAILLLLLRLSAGTWLYRVMLRGVAGPVTLFAAPAGWLLVQALTSKWPLAHWLPANPLWRTVWLRVFAAELVFFCVLPVLSRRRTLSSAMCGTLLALHYALWIGILWPGSTVTVYGLFAPYLLLLIFPLAGFVWLAYIKRPWPAVEASRGNRAGRGTWSLALLALASLLMVWGPSSNHSLAHSQDIRSLTLQLSRGPCYGPCPSYTLTIHGSGLVEYVGRREVKIRGLRTATITEEQLRSILRRLDDARFFALDDRAFAWCFDTPSVSVSLSLDGNSKRVVSDAGCVGAKSGLQAQFVRSTNDIDTIVGSERWVRCNGHCPR